MSEIKYWQTPEWKAKKSEYDKKRYRENPERKRKHNKEYYQQNIEKFREKNRKSRERRKAMEEETCQDN